jgi:hypothetical protein
MESKTSPIDYFREIIQDIVRHAKSHNTDLGLDPTNPETLFELRNSKQASLQSVFTESFFKTELENFKASLNKESSPKKAHLAWFNSSSACPHSGLWLTAAPAEARLQMSNAQFATAARLRLFLPSQNATREQKCKCKRHPTMDLQALHFISGCKEESSRQDIHNAVVNTTASLLHFLGFVVKTKKKTASTKTTNDPTSPSSIPSTPMRLTSST